MRSLGTYTPPETVGLEFSRLATPRGFTMQRAPITGELFTLESDMPEPINGTPWYTRGTYVYTGSAWSRLSDTSRERKAVPIGACKIEVETPGSLEDEPKDTDGFDLSSQIMITPSNRRATMSGAATCWIDLENSGYVWLTIFRGAKLVGMTAAYIEANRPSSLSLTFMDAPAAITRQAYNLKINTASSGLLFVNQCNQHLYDGASQTAFIISENN